MLDPFHTCKANLQAAWPSPSDCRLCRETCTEAEFANRARPSAGILSMSKQLGATNFAWLSHHRAAAGNAMRTRMAFCKDVWGVCCPCDRLSMRPSMCVPVIRMARSCSCSSSSRAPPQDSVLKPCLTSRHQGFSRINQERLRMSLLPMFYKVVPGAVWGQVGSMHW